MKSFSLICRCSPPFPNIWNSSPCGLEGGNAAEKTHLEREQVGERQGLGPLSSWLSGEPRGLSGNVSVRTNTARWSRACHRIARGENLKLQLVLPFNDRSYRTLETRHVLRGSIRIYPAKGLWEIWGDDGGDAFWKRVKLEPFFMLTRINCYSLSAFKPYYVTLNASSANLLIVTYVLRGRLFQIRSFLFALSF